MKRSANGKALVIWNLVDWLASASELTVLGV